jgi:hypothetical protein
MGEGAESFGIIERYEPYEISWDAEPIVEVMMKAINENYSLSSITPP